MERIYNKTVGGTIAIGVEMFKLTECLKDPLLIQNYFEEYKGQYDKFLIQELIKGFKKQGEIKKCGLMVNILML